MKPFTKKKTPPVAATPKKAPGKKIVPGAKPQWKQIADSMAKC